MYVSITMRLYPFGLSTILFFITSTILYSQTCDFSKPNSRDASWHPNGKSLVFDSKRNRDPSNIFSINLEDSTTSQLTNTVSSDYYPFYSPDGSKIVYMALGADNSVIRVMNTDGSENKALTAEDGNNGDPEWHPDGSKIIFFSERDGNSEIYTMNVDGSDQKRITFTPEKEETTPSWSPNGSTILFVGAQEGNSDIYLMDQDGSNVRRLTESSWSDRVPRWNPTDDNSIIFYSRPTTKLAGSSQESWRQAELVMINATGTDFREITQNSWLDQSPCISPDGQRITYTSCQSGSREVWIMKINGSEAKRITFTYVPDN